MKAKLRVTGYSGWTADSDREFDVGDGDDGVCIDDVGDTLQEEFGLEFCIGDKIELVEVKDGDD